MKAEMINWNQNCSGLHISADAKSLQLYIPVPSVWVKREREKEGEREKWLGQIED